MKKNLGFTFIELMTVVAIIGVLAMVAIPAYGGYVANSHKASVQTRILEISSLLERDRLQNRLYSAELVKTLNQTSDNKFPSNSDHRYTISIIREDLSYTITATPMAKQKKTSCTSKALTLDSLGRRQPAECW